MWFYKGKKSDSPEVAGNAIKQESDNKKEHDAVNIDDVYDLVDELNESIKQQNKLVLEMIESFKSLKTDLSDLNKQITHATMKDGELYSLKEYNKTLTEWIQNQFVRVIDIIASKPEHPKLSTAAQAYLDRKNGTGASGGNSRMPLP